VTLASDDVRTSNNWAQKNVTKFVALSGSPYQPIHFTYSVSNDGVRPEEAYLEPEQLPVGMKLTVTPSVRVIAPKETAIFSCKLELDDAVIDAGHRNDPSFLLVTWRNTEEASERWGAVKYTVQPRRRTDLSLKGSWSANSTVSVHGTLSPDPAGSGFIRLFVSFKGGKPQWLALNLQPGGTYATQFPVRPPDAPSVELMAHFEGTTELAPAYSPVLHLKPP
jgi:hypothetical protein